MSLYGVNKLMRRVNMEPRDLAAYRSDARDYVARFVAATTTDDFRRQPDGAELSSAERAALEQRDYGALYALGAHPYLLWSFTEAVWVPEVTRPELVASFRSAAAAAGYPDFATTPLGAATRAANGVST